VIREVLTKCDDAIVVIGSAEESHTADNPFTAGERYQMILSSLTEDQKSKVYIIPIRDVNRYSAWVNHVESYVPPFDVVYSNSDLTGSLFSQAGYKVSRTKAYSSKQYSGTEIRRRIVSGGRWENLVPDPVAAIIDSMDGRGRLMDAGMKPSRKRSCDDSRR